MTEANSEKKIRGCLVYGSYFDDGRIVDYPAALMVNDTIYLVEGGPLSVEVDDSAIIGYAESYTDTFPKNNGGTNFNPELGMPYAQVEGGIAILYQNEWYLGTPFPNAAGENTNCGTDFHLNILDEKTGEWRDLDTVIDDAAFDAIAIMIQKDSPYETVIDFEWLYGKLKPGRYQIVKTVMDFRGTGDYISYTSSEDSRYEVRIAGKDQSFTVSDMVKPIQRLKEAVRLMKSHLDK